MLENLMKITLALVLLVISVRCLIFLSGIVFKLILWIIVIGTIVYIANMVRGKFLRK